jgi:serine/threonine protein kinase
MIKGKYKPVEMIKNSGYKIVQRCIRQDGALFFLKSYAEEERKLIQNEVQTYQKLKQPHLHGFPEIKEAFEENGRTYLVIEELGENLENLRQRCGGRFTLKTATMIALQSIDRIEYLHRN